MSRRRRNRRFHGKSRELYKKLKEKYKFKSRKDLEDFLDLAESCLELQILEHLIRKTRQKPSYIS